MIAIADTLASVFSTPPDMIALLPRCPMPHLITVPDYLLRASPVVALIGFAAHRSGWPRRIALGASILETSAVIGGLFWQSYQHSPYTLGASIAVAVWIGLLTYVVNVEPNAIISPPGTLLLRGARWVYTQRTFEIVFEAQIAETQFEYYEALQRGQKLKAEWVQLRGCCGFWLTALAQLSETLFRLLVLLLRGH